MFSEYVRNLSGPEANALISALDQEADAMSAIMDTCHRAEVITGKAMVDIRLANDRATEAMTQLVNERNISSRLAKELESAQSTIKWLCVINIVFFVALAGMAFP